MTKYLDDRFLVRAIEKHIRIVQDGENVDLESIGYEEGTPLDRVHDYNALTILTSLEFPIDQATKSQSAATRLLDSLAKEESVESIIAGLIAYKEEIAKS